MSKVSRESAPEVADHVPVEDRTDHFHGYTVNFTTIRQDSDLAHHAQGVARRQLPMPALGLCHRRPPDGPLRRTRGGHPPR